MNRCLLWIAEKLRCKFHKIRGRRRVPGLKAGLIVSLHSGA